MFSQVMTKSEKAEKAEKAGSYKKYLYFSFILSLLHMCESIRKKGKMSLKRGF